MKNQNRIDFGRVCQILSNDCFEKWDMTLVRVISYLLYLSQIDGAGLNRAQISAIDLIFESKKGRIGMNELIQKQIVIMGVAGVCMLYFLVKMMLRHTYRKLIRAARDMGHSRHRLMKTLRMKFNTCYQLRIGVPNVSLFVKKYLGHYRVLGIYLKTWENFTSFCVVFVMVGSMGSAIWAMMYDLPSSTVFSQLLTGVLGTGTLLLFDYLWNTANQWELLHIDITDYLENVCKPRLENEIFHPVDVEKYRKEYFDEEQDALNKVVNLVPKEKDSVTMKEIEFTPEEEDVIREVIQEYLG